MWEAALPLQGFLGVVVLPYRSSAKNLCGLLLLEAGPLEDVRMLEPVGVLLPSRILGVPGVFRPSHVLGVPLSSCALGVFRPSCNLEVLPVPLDNLGVLLPPLLREPKGVVDLFLIGASLKTKSIMASRSLNLSFDLDRVLVGTEPVGTGTLRICAGGAVGGAVGVGVMF